MLKKLWLSLFVGLLLISTSQTILATNIVNINTATQEQLETLKGVGPSIAKGIIAYRIKSGGFKSVEEITLVKGIAGIKLSHFIDRLVVSDSEL